MTDRRRWVSEAVGSDYRHSREKTTAVAAEAPCRPYNPRHVALTPGTHLAPYEIAAQIDLGGMGEVYQARDTKLDRDVAIKVLPSSRASRIIHPD